VALAVIQKGQRGVAWLMLLGGLLGLSGCEAIASFDRSKISGSMSSDAGTPQRDASTDAMVSGDAAGMQDAALDAALDAGHAGKDAGTHDAAILDSGASGADAGSSSDSGSADGG
jgi:hypothetical protein